MIICSHLFALPSLLLVPFAKAAVYPIRTQPKTLIISLLSLSSYFYAVAVASTCNANKMLHTFTVYSSSEKLFHGKWNEAKRWRAAKDVVSLSATGLAMARAQRKITVEEELFARRSHKYHIINLFSNWIYFRGVNRKSALSLFAFRSGRATVCVSERQCIIEFRTIVGDVSFDLLI